MLYTNIQRIVGMDTIKGKINTRTTTRRDTRLSVDRDATANNPDSLLIISPSQLHCTMKLAYGVPDHPWSPTESGD